MTIEEQYAEIKRAFGHVPSSQYVKGFGLFDNVGFIRKLQELSYSDRRLRGTR